MNTMNNPDQNYENPIKPGETGLFIKKHNVVIFYLIFGTIAITSFAQFSAALCSKVG